MSRSTSRRASCPRLCRSRLGASRSSLLTQRNVPALRAASIRERASSAAMVRRSKGPCGRLLKHRSQNERTGPEVIAAPFRAAGCSGRPWLALPQRNECPHRDNPGMVVALEGQQIALVAGDQIIRVTGYGHSQQVVVVGIGRNLHDGQLFEHRRQLAQIVHHPPCLHRPDTEPDPLASSDAADFLELLVAGEQREFARAPRLIGAVGRRVLRDQCGNQNIGVEHNPHGRLHRPAGRRPHFRPHSGAGFVNRPLQLIGGDVGVARLDGLHVLVKHPPTHGVLDEAGDVALAHPLRSQKGTQRQIGFPGNRHRPPCRRILSHDRTYAYKHLSIYQHSTFYARTPVQNRRRPSRPLYPQFHE
ncbi:hypothetical protein p2A53 (plasmid) [Aromatoleum aromaticum EbN1]|uniref:Uncharacterized protein n=1 Tax=Aromatoleum aromaticum (strain DSM 19018 / LMG 30748 / EbN1) TaxID=76114 RepID=Q5NWK6_AROAE|nr:hypothetical protein p2A53 [Aromatoleum aromaticum EbN1]